MRALLIRPTTRGNRHAITQDRPDSRSARGCPQNRPRRPARSLEPLHRAQEAGIRRGEGVGLAQRLAVERQAAGRGADVGRQLVQLERAEEGARAVAGAGGPQAHGLDPERVAGLRGVARQAVVGGGQHQRQRLGQLVAEVAHDLQAVLGVVAVVVVGVVLEVVARGVPRAAVGQHGAADGGHVLRARVQGVHARDGARRAQQLVPEAAPGEDGPAGVEALVVLDGAPGRESVGDVPEPVARVAVHAALGLVPRAGRGLVATPRAFELRERVRQVVQDAEAVRSLGRRTCSHTSRPSRLRQCAASSPMRPAPSR